MRFLLRRTINELQKSRSDFEIYPVSTDSDMKISGLALCAIDASIIQLMEALDPLLIRSGEKEPLDTQEEVYFENLPTWLRMKEEPTLTHDQRFSAARCITQQGFREFQESWMDGEVLFLKFKHILIGVEKDGYAHS